ncbi:Asp/Glu/Hydantoin racemase [compost metagenome]
MEAIYGERGIKAGFTEGLCRDQLLIAAEHLSEIGAQVLILGCTELPLVLSHCDAYELRGRTVALVDPTMILARKCVALAGVPVQVGGCLLGPGAAVQPIATQGRPHR